MLEDWGPLAVHAVCDVCADAEEELESAITGQRPSWAEACALLRDLGWEIRGDDGDWTHVCPDCVERGL